MVTDHGRYYSFVSKKNFQWLKECYLRVTKSILPGTKIKRVLKLSLGYDTKWKTYRQHHQSPWQTVHPLVIDQWRFRVCIHEFL